MQKATPSAAGEQLPVQVREAERLIPSSLLKMDAQTLGSSDSSSDWIKIASPLLPTAEVCAAVPPDSAV